MVLLLLRLLVLAGVIAWVSAELPVVEVRGNHFEIGQQIGRRFKDEITRRFDTDNDLARIMTYVKSRAGATVFDGLRRTVLAVYPEYVEEIQGMAEGTGLPFETMLAANMIAELAAKAGMKGVTDCSDVIVNNAEQTLIGHNEDNNNGTLHTSFIVVAHITANDSRTTGYTSMHYPGQLAGDSFGFNTHGIVFSTNALFPTDGGAGVPRIFLGRDLLTSTSFTHMMAKVNTPHGRASGFSVNAGSVVDGRVFNMELAPNFFSVREIHGNGAHFNQYLVLDTPHHYEPSSDHRLARYLQLPLPTNAREIFNILGDTQDKEWPIYRNGEAPDTGCVTIATALFDLRARTLSVYTSNPKTAGSPAIVFDIKQHFEQ